MSALAALRDSAGVKTYARAIFVAPDGTRTDWSEYIGRGSRIDRVCDSGSGATLMFDVPKEVPDPVWPRDILELSVVVEGQSSGDGGELPLGRFCAETPSWAGGSSVRSLRLQCYDIATALETPYGHTVSVSASETAAQGIKRLVLDEANWMTYSPLLQSQELVATPLAASSWPVGNNNYAGILNDLLTWSAWRPFWTDRQGVVTSGPWSELHREDIYNFFLLEDDIAPGPVRKDDNYGVPNEGVFINWILGTATKRTLSVTDPANSLYYLTEANRGRPVRVVTEIDTQTEDGFTAAVDRAWTEMTAAPTTLCFEMPPVPIFWHRDGFSYSNEDLGFDKAKFLIHNFTLPLDGSGNMRVVANFVPSLEGLPDGATTARTSSRAAHQPTPLPLPPARPVVTPTSPVADRIASDDARIKNFGWTTFSQTVVLSWRVDTSAEVVVERSQNNGPFGLFATTAPGEQGFTDAFVSGGNTYQYRVSIKPSDSFGSPRYTTDKLAVTGSTDNDDYAVRDLQEVLKHQDTTISWTPVTQAVAGRKFQIRRRVAARGSVWQDIGTTADGTFQFKDTTAVNGGRYVWAVRAENAAGSVFGPWLVSAAQVIQHTPPAITPDMSAWGWNGVESRQTRVQDRSNAGYNIGCVIHGAWAYDLEGLKNRLNRGPRPGGYHYLVDQTGTLLYADPRFARVANTANCWTPYAGFRGAPIDPSDEGPSGDQIAVVINAEESLTEYDALWSLVPTATRAAIWANVKTVLDPFKPSGGWVYGAYGNIIGHGNIDQKFSGTNCYGTAYVDFERTDPGVDFPWQELLDVLNS